MSLLNFIRLPARAWITFSAIAAAITLGVHGQAEDVPPQGKKKVREFEQRMWLQMGEENRHNSKIRESEAVKREVRTFFAGLDSSDLRLEAMDLIDSRFFGAHIVSGELGPELLGPLIRDADLSVRVRAARAIGAVGCGAQYAKELIALLDGELSAEALEDVAYALGRSQHQPFAKHLEKPLGQIETL